MCGRNFSRHGAATRTEIPRGFVQLSLMPCQDDTQEIARVNPGVPADKEVWDGLPEIRTAEWYHRVESVRNHHALTSAIDIHAHFQDEAAGRHRRRPGTRGAQGRAVGR